MQECLVQHHLCQQENGKWISNEESQARNIEYRILGSCFFKWGGAIAEKYSWNTDKQEKHVAA